MFGKSKDEAAEDRGPVSTPQFLRSTVAHTAPVSPEATSSISAGTSIVGKVVSDGTVNIFGRIEGELRASTVVIAEGAQVEGDLVAEDLTIGGRVKGIVHANRVKLNSTAIVEGDIYHRSLAIEENARFEGSSRREENVIDAPARAPAARPQTQLAAIDPARKHNGAPANEAHAKPATD
ncbi:MAG: polymer-forming cytoskeletal protein [Xanthobacteraceae bacterium]|jgi:cytoskeletal protein CcmA (bactofilin family)